MGFLNNKTRIFVGDFETVVYDNQTETEVWASAIVELNTEEVIILNSIDKTWNYLLQLSTDRDIMIYYHNLKFDGAFWMSYLLKDLKLSQAFERIGENELDIAWVLKRKMKNKTFKYSISDMGQWYSITVKINDHYIEFRDSYKLLPFSVADIGKSFGTKHKKTSIEYKGYRTANGIITDREKEYIANDVLVIKEALEIMIADGHDKLTIGACCLHEFKRTFDRTDYNILFPDLSKIEIKREVYGSNNADEYIRKSYKGGWCYVVKGKENKEYANGLTADVNSLYPSVMHSDSGNRYPHGKPMFWKGNFIDEKACKPNVFYFVRIKTRFYLNEGYLPFIQIKGNHLYKGNENLETSDYYDEETGQYYTHYRDKEGNLHDTRVTLTLTMTDFALLKEHYELVDFEILDGCYFYAQRGIFDEYINKYADIKMKSKGALRTEAKLFLNNLYGKLSSSNDSSFKVAYVKEDESIGFYNIPERNKQSGYIACGSAVTSYARNFTITHAQLNYHGQNKRGFIYADTDSIHCDLEPSELLGINVHPTAFSAWKLESYWDNAIFVRQKTYIEHVTHDDGETVEPYYNIKCAGMPKSCKNLLDLSLRGALTEQDKDNYNTKEQHFLFNKNGKPITRTLTDFNEGLIVPGKLLPKRIKGGIVLVDTEYTMK